MADSDDICEYVEPPPFERVVRQKRFDPRKKLEENTRRRLERESQAAIAAEEARILASQAASSRVPTVMGSPQKPMRGGFTLGASAPRSTDQAMDAPSCSSQSDNDDLQQRDRIVMPKRFNPQRRLQDKMDQRREKESWAPALPLPPEESPIKNRQSRQGDYEYIWPRDIPRREQPPQGDYEYIMPRDSPRREQPPQGNYEYIMPRDSPRREQPPQGNYEYIMPRDSPRREQPPQGNYEYIMPRDSPRREPTTNLYDLPASESQASSPQFHEQPQPLGRNKTSSLIRKKPVLARWPFALSELDSESPSKRTKTAHPPQIALPSKPRRSSFAAASPRQISDQTVIAEYPVTPNRLQSPVALSPALTPRSRASLYLEPTEDDEYSSLLMKVPPQKPARKRKFESISATDEQDQFVSVGQPRPDMSPFQSPQIESTGDYEYLMPRDVQEPRLDAFCTSASVFGLNGTNFRDFLGDKNAALVMFYKPFKSSCVKGRKYFVKAAESNERENSAFAAVDCSMEEALCLKEDINSVPTYKIYAQGQLVNTVKDFLFFNDRAMKKFVDNVPPFTQDGIAKPPCSTGQSLLKKAFQKLKI